MNCKPITVLSFFIISIIQLTNTAVYSQPAAKQIKITIKRIEYDNPHLTSLREDLKKNMKIKSLKPSYVAGTATLSFTYAGDAPQLWDEIPQPTRQYF